MQKRDIFDSLQKELQREDVLVLTGSRQVGKTTTIKWLLSQIDSENKYYFDLENIRNRSIFDAEDYDQIVLEFKSLGLDTNNRMYIAIDEIQLMPNIPSVIKYLYDHYNIKFIITGSSSYYLKNYFNESLAGRKSLYELFPLSFGEFLRFKNENYKLNNFSYDLDFEALSYQKLKFLYKEYIEYGGLPKVVLTDSYEEKKRQLELIFSSYVNIDVLSMADFRSMDSFIKLIQLLASRIGNKLNVSQISKVLGINRATVEAYLSFMEQTYLIRLIRPYSNSADVRLRISPKLYFVDNGIANINYSISAGAKFENIISHQLYLHANESAFGRELEYYSDSTGEIDFVLNKEMAFEVKESPVENNIAKLEKLSKKIGINKSRLIGNNPPADFNDFIWGGMID